MVLVSPALAQQQQPVGDAPLEAVADAAQPAVDAAAPAINAPAPSATVADPALPSATGRAQNSPPLQPQPAAKADRPEPLAERAQPEPVTGLVRPAVDVAKPELRAPQPAGTAGVPASRRTQSNVGAVHAAGPMIGRERPRLPTGEAANGEALPLLGTPQVLSETHSLLDPVADTAQSLLGPLGDATQPLLGSLGDAVMASAREAVSLSRRDLPGTGEPDAGAPLPAPLSESTSLDPWVSPVPGAVLGESAGSPVVGSRQSPLLRLHPADVPLWHPATSSQATFAAPPEGGAGATAGAEGSAPSSLAGTAAGPGSSGSAPFAPIGLLLLLALATPSLSRFLRTVPAFLRPTPFICALERPG